jgi:hypothetical protein
MSTLNQDNRFVMQRRDRSFKNLTATRINMCPVQIGEGASADPTLGFATAVGCQSTAGDGATALGFAANATASSLAVGTAATTYGTGLNPTTGGTAIGSNTKSIGIGSVSLGRDSTASGLFSTSIGGSFIEANPSLPNNKTIASGTASIAIGSGAESLSNYPALGSGNAALQIPAETTFTQTNVLYIRLNNSANLFAIPLMLTNIPATPVD